MDLLSMLGSGSGGGGPPSAPTSSGGSVLDLMMDSGPLSSGHQQQSPAAPSSVGSSSGGGGLDALLEMNSPPSSAGGAPGSAGGAVPATAQIVPPAPITVFDKNGVKIVMQFAPQPDGILFVQLVSTNSSKEEVKSFTLLMAVPTYVKLQMAAPSGNVLPPGGQGQVTQQVRIENTEKPKPTLVRLKVDFSTISGGKFSEVVNVQSFPSHL